MQAADIFIISKVIMALFGGVLVVFVFVSVNGCFAQLSCQKKSDLRLKNRYDFVIVGAGSAGSVVANRLTEIADVTVLLLEAGGEDDPILNEIPQLSGKLMFSYQDWKFITAVQNATFFSNVAKQFIYSRGKVLGGSSSINSMVYVRGNRKDYDAWNTLVGSGWSYEDVLPYFRKSEDNRVKNMDAHYHGFNGSLTVTENKNSLTDMFMKAANEVGLITRDVNGAMQTGVMPMQFTIRNGSRCSTNKGFLKSASNRKNLDILLHAFVTKVVLKKISENKAEAKGIVFQCGNTVRTITVNKEVILSAGTIQSPQLLLLSGIGPKKQLEQFKIPLKVHLLGVGENFRDHIILTGLYYASNRNTTKSTCPVTVDYQSQLLEWTFNRTGPLTSPFGPPSVVAFSSTSKKNQRMDWPDIQMTFIPPIAVGGTIDDSAIASCLVTLLRVEGSGFVRLSDDNPMAPPLIDPRFLSQKSDLDALIGAVKLCESYANTTAFRSAGISFRIPSIPLCKKFNKESDDYRVCVVQELVNPGWHCVGTCKMGNKTDPMSVVNSQFRVHNVTRLRVIDASIMPQTPSGNTNAPSIMIGERGADFIKKYWKLNLLE